MVGCACPGPRETGFELKMELKGITGHIKRCVFRIPCIFSTENIREIESDEFKQIQSESCVGLFDEEICINFNYESSLEI